MECETCETCKFWLTFTGKLKLDRCRRFPKQRTPFMLGGWSAFSFSEFPEAYKDDWCGEHAPRGEE